MQDPLKLVVLATALAAVLATERSICARETAPEPAPAFSLLPPVRCDEAADVRGCHVARPKDWLPEERQLIRDTMRRLTSDPLVQGLLVGARDNGFKGLHRYSTDTKEDPAQGTVPSFSPGFVLFTTRVIVLTDAFFDTDDVRDAIADYRFGDLILVHELVHAFDDRKGSAAPGFTSLMGWVRNNDRWQYGNPVNFSSYLGVYADTLTLQASGRYREAWTRDRSFATSMKFPLPTIQSLASPGESFADVLAHLIVDPAATRYLKPQVVSWFEGNIFPALKEKSSRFNAADYELF